MQDTVKNFSMKTKISEIEKPKYPALYISSDIVVLMTSGASGTVVHAENSVYQLGYTSDDWDMSSFQPFEGKLTLEN